MNTETLELKQNGEYILQYQHNGCGNHTFKIRVYEVTKTTYLFNNIDIQNPKQRLSKEEFNKVYKVIEDLNNTFDKESIHNQIEKIKALRDQLEKSSITKEITNDLINRQRFCDFGEFVHMLRYNNLTKKYE